MAWLSFANALSAHSRRVRPGRARLGSGSGSGKAARRSALTSALLLAFLLTAAVAVEASPPPPGPAGGDREGYILIGWNDLGMHCSNKLFADLAVLPPYNTVWATLIRRGSAGIPPEVAGPGFTVTHHFPANTWSVGKTDFWSWEDRLFGVNLPDNIGLTGRALADEMHWATDHFVAEGIPLTPFDDADLAHEQPFQLATLQAFDAQQTMVASTEIVAPVSNEMTCNACHVPQTGETVDHSILRLHDDENGTHLLADRPVLCANCHASNALGLPGLPGLPSLSLAMHDQHSEHTNNCYLCHPGPNTQCLRDVMSEEFGLVCQSCHGGMLQVAQSIEDGRRPWLDEPRCETCHGAQYAEEPATLYRNSNNGHGGLYCPTCHNSPHAILPSREERDNRQVVALQGHATTLRDCRVCHGVIPSGPGPHGLSSAGIAGLDAGVLEAWLAVAPNPMFERAEIRYRVPDPAPIRLSVLDVTGREVRLLAGRAQTPGDHTLVWDGRDAAGREVPGGVYFARLEAGGSVLRSRLVRLGR
ncbi:MAG: FlgD immunoglobulin-like domain containing protein [Candidatus Eisenbacteria bacterium]|nr:FlgD immunoglobulin-like domain containing protein [Candidatus Eisenbacteria bacterium]